MKRRTGVRELLEEALAAHEAFRRLDVAPDEIFFGVQSEGDPRDPSKALGLAAFIKVQRHNGFEFNYICGPVKDDAEKDLLAEMWPKAAKEWNEAEDMDKERERIWRESNIGQNAAWLATAWSLKLMGWKAKKGL